MDLILVIQQTPIPKRLLLYLVRSLWFQPQELFVKEKHSHLQARKFPRLIMGQSYGRLLTDWERLHQIIIWRRFIPQLLVRLEL